MQEKLNNKKMSPAKTAFIGAFITLVGGFFLSYNYVQSKKIVAYDYMANAFYNGNEIVNIVEKEDTKEPIKEEELPEEVSNEYIGYLVIPKINLTKGFLDSRSTENDVEKNILVVDGSNYPDTDKGNLILAGHSGTGLNYIDYKLMIQLISHIKIKSILIVLLIFINNQRQASLQSIEIMIRQH